MSLKIERKFLVCGEFRKNATEATEIEIVSADEAFEKPPWLGEEVSGDPRFYNSSLSAKPFSCW